jgi:nucleotide-binding universal stress UspA family protein
MAILTTMDLVVLGVDRIQGETLNFGGVAAAVISNSKVSVLLIADGEANRKG